MRFTDLRDFTTYLQRQQHLSYLHSRIDPHLEVTELAQRSLERGGPALWLAQPARGEFPMLCNLFGHRQRILWGMGLQNDAQLAELADTLADLRDPGAAVQGRSLLGQLPLVKKVLDMSPKTLGDGECQAHVWQGRQVDLNRLPIATCWPGDAGPLLTWPLVVTHSRNKNRLNVGIYRQQLIGPNRLIMRWLAHRGGALDYAEWQAHSPREPFPVSVVIGADPATLLAAVVPIPDTLSEYAFAGLFRGEKSRLVRCLSNDLLVPATAEFVLEGWIYPDDVALEGPFGDHTGYYNETATFPVMTVETVTHRHQPVYLSTHTGKPPDEPSVLGSVMNELMVPMLRKQFPEIVDFYLPPAACSYRVAIVSIQKQYPGHAQRIMMGVWSYLRQFSYTKFVIVTDADIDIRNWDDVIWAISTRAEPERDLMMVRQTPIDYLDFASVQAGLGSKLGIDATGKWPGETHRNWGTVIQRDAGVRQRVDRFWSELQLD
jgi:4-hydroxy-3-polyprenylbenzoate decarboxylase